MKMTFDFYCPTCPRVGTYAEEVSGHDRQTTPATFATRAKVAAMSHGWVSRSALPNGAAIFLKTLLVCPDCACDAIDCSRVTWTEAVR